MTTQELQKFADDYEETREVEMEYTGFVYEERTACYKAGFLKAIELVNKLNDGSKCVIQVYDTADYSSQRECKDIFKELLP